MQHVMILGDSGDFHACHIRDALEATGKKALLLDISRFPEHIQLSWDPQSGAGHIDGLTERSLSFDDIGAVYWRTLKLPDFNALADREEWTIAHNDGFSLIRTLLLEPGIRWVNGYDAYRFHQVKPRQLSLASKLGALIPPTVITNNPRQVIDFIETWCPAIYKPVQGGAHTEMVTPEMLEPERLQKVLSLCPVTLQKYIEGTNIRTYVLGDNVYSAEIASEAVDFRTDMRAEVSPIQTPDAIAQLSKKLTSAFGMVWTAIDWRRDGRGTYHFLEANPSPMFYHFEQCTNYPITDDLVRLLARDSDKTA